MRLKRGLAALAVLYSTTLGTPSQGFNTHDKPSRTVEEVSKSSSIEDCFIKEPCTYQDDCPTGWTCLSVDIDDNRCYNNDCNYCGLNAALESRLTNPRVVSFLNESCFKHDACYDTECITGYGCHWTRASYECDRGLDDACTAAKTHNIDDIKEDSNSILVCGIISDLTNHARSNPWCLDACFPWEQCFSTRPWEGTCYLEPEVPTKTKTPTNTPSQTRTPTPLQIYSKTKTPTRNIPTKTKTKTRTPTATETQIRTPSNTGTFTKTPVAEEVYVEINNAQGYTGEVIEFDVGLRIPPGLQNEKIREISVYVLPPFFTKELGAVDISELRETPYCKLNKELKGWKSTNENKPPIHFHYQEYTSNDNSNQVNVLRGGVHVQISAESEHYTLHDSIKLFDCSTKIPARAELGDYPITCQDFPDHVPSLRRGANIYTSDSKIYTGCTSAKLRVLGNGIPTLLPTNAYPPTRTKTKTPSPAPIQLPGDCNGDGSISVADLTTIVNIALKTASLERCKSADMNGDRKISITEITDAAIRALQYSSP